MTKGMFCASLLVSVLGDDVGSGVVVTADLE